MIHTLRIFLLAGAALLTLPVAVAAADDEGSVKLDDSAKRLSYSLGYQIGGDFRRQGVEMDADAVVLGIQDALAAAEPKIPHKAMNEILAELKRKVVAGERANQQNKASRSREIELQYVAEGKEFLRTNAEKPGVKTTASGLQYKIIEPGSDRKPGPSDKVTVNYTGTLINGQEFDRSKAGPVTFALDRVIKGWTEGLQLIGEGGKIQLFVPHVLAYRNSGPLAHRTLIFDVELVSVEKDGQAEAKQ